MNNCQMLRFPTNRQQ